MEPGHQKQIAKDIDDAGHQHEQQRRFAVTQPAEDGGHHVVSHNEEDARAADTDIAGRQRHCLHRSLHQHRDGPCKAHQRHKQHHRDQGKHHRRAANDLPDILGLFLTQIPGNEHGNAHGELCDHECDQVEHLAARGYRRKARGSAKVAHHQKVHGTVSRL